jgi:hypothetical protein
MAQLAFLFVISLLTFTLEAALTAGEIVCRYKATTKSEANYYTCHELSQKYSMSVEKFFLLNTVDTDCNTIKLDTEYCVDGCK